MKTRPGRMVRDVRGVRRDGSPWHGAMRRWVVPVRRGDWDGRRGAGRAEAGEVWVGCRVIVQAQGLTTVWVRTDDVGVDWTDA